MKKTQIVLLVLVAVSVSVIIAMFGKFSTYETFASAAQNPGKQYMVMGFLEKEKGVEFNPTVDANHCSFFVKDKSGMISKVIFNGAKPTDIERSEQIVMTGYVNDGTFHCSKIQMKCPSKYKKDQIVVGSEG